VRDGAAIADFLAWFAVEAPKGELDEIKVVDKLWSFRAGKDIVQGISFDTISAAGSNAALCHYKVAEETNLPIKNGELFLLDSGGQYSDGTTDITRTMIVGTPSAEHKDRFTRVLKGHIALSSTHFPKGTSGQALDSIARKPLWDVGLDYDHGTGHGVGCYLGVHEGPQRIAKLGSSVPLLDGMILSNEPGYYKAGEYGIRIENLVLVKCDEDDPEGRGMMHFENLTWAPIDRNLIEIDLLNDAELAWLNQYHATVRDKLVDSVSADARDWLLAATEPLAR
ncbi:MAG: M24 family metallopeptidase, partial [Sphingomonadales bacterium]|nr:M24 family metallopeptidase [Sphingomonadales bacterium]